MMNRDGGMQMETMRRYQREEMLRMHRPLSDRIPMDRQRRAKQFAPFQALKGFEHSIREAETVYVERRLLSDESRLTIDQKLRTISPGLPVEILYFQPSMEHPGLGMYVTIYGIPKYIPSDRLVQIGGLEIAYDDIIRIEEAEES